jgi:hypothetical protein
MEHTADDLQKYVNSYVSEKHKGEPDQQEDNFTMLKMVRNPCLAMFKTNIKRALHD